MRAPNPPRQDPFFGSRSRTARRPAPNAMVAQPNPELPQIGSDPSRTGTDAKTAAAVPREFERPESAQRVNRNPGRGQQPHWIPRRDRRPQPHRAPGGRRGSPPFRPTTNCSDRRKSTIIVHHGRTQFTAMTQCTTPATHPISHPLRPDGKRSRASRRSPGKSNTSGTRPGPGRADPKTAPDAAARIQGASFFTEQFNRTGSCHQQSAVGGWQLAVCVVPIGIVCRIRNSEFGKPIYWDPR